MSPTLSDPRRETSDLPGLAALLEGVRLGHPLAEQRLWQRYRRGAWLLAHRLCRGDRAAADDLVQEVCSEVTLRLRQGELRHAELFPHYLWQSLRNRHRAQRRATRRGSPVFADGSDVADLIQPDPLQQLLHAEWRLHVLQLMQELPQERDRELLYRFHVLQQDRDVICDDLGIDPAHFRRVLSRARQRMRDLLGNASTPPLAEPTADI